MFQKVYVQLDDRFIVGIVLIGFVGEQRVWLLSAHELRTQTMLQKKLHENSARVKCVDLHKVEPWVLSGLYSGSLNVYNYDNGKLLKTFDACELPVRCCKFVCSKHWILCGSDDFRIRVFNYNTSAKITDFEAHSDFIRSF